jgi:Na+-driven multidrug efflux pump
MWGVVIPVSLMLSYLTGLNIFILFPLCQATEILKAVFGGILLKKIRWAKQLS